MTFELKSDLKQGVVFFNMSLRSKFMSVSYLLLIQIQRNIASTYVIKS